MSAADRQHERDARLHAAWAAYVTAREKAERSRLIADGIAAGRAWVAFLALFETRPVEAGEAGA